MRAGLPALIENEAVANERKFYSLLLKKAGIASQAARFEQVWDIGCRSWSYASALAEVFPRATLIGVEVDGGRRMADLYRRRDYAEAYAEKLKTEGRNLELRFGDFRKMATPRNAAVFYCAFFPFVSKRPCRKWGLPARFAEYDELLEGMIQNETYGILSAHQGEWEAELARKIYLKKSIQVSEIIIESKEFLGLWPNAFDIHLFTKIC